MKILVISNLYPPVVRGGYEVACASIVEGLRARGDDVVVLTSRVDRRRSPLEPHVHRILPLLEHSPSDALRAPLAAIKGARATRDLLTSFRPDFVFAWNCAGIPHSVVYTALESGVPTAFRISEHWFGRLFSGDLFARHLFPGDRGVRRGWAGVIRLVNRHPSLQLDFDSRVPAGVAWNSEFMHTSVPMPPMIEPALEKVILSTSPWTEIFENVPRRPAARPLICFAGRLSIEKGPEIAIEALAGLPSRGVPDAELVLAGTATRRRRRALERQAESLGVRDRCTFAGQLDRPAICELLSRAHALVVPSLWAEPFPQNVTEGALARVPIVASNVGGIPELVADGEHALLFEIADSQGCADALAAVLTRPEETAARVERAFARARGLSWAECERQMMAFVDEALDVLRGRLSRGPGS